MPPITTTDLSDRRVAVVGATGGVGRALVRELVAAGADVVAGARSEADLDTLPAGVRVRRIDVRSSDQIDEFLASAAADGPIDVLVDVSGVVAIGPVAELSEDAIRTVVETDLIGPMLLTRAAVPRLAEGGRLVFAGAVTAEEPTAQLAVHSAAKGGLAAFVAAVRHELREAPIHVDEVRLPHLDTGLEDRAVEGTPGALTLGPPTAVESAVAALMEAIRGAEPTIRPHEVVESAGAEG